MKNSASTIVRSDDEARVQRRLADARRLLEEEAGLAGARPQTVSKPEERPFTSKERAAVTILFGGLTWKHEKLLRGAFEALGYKCENLPTPDVRAFQIGKEYGNNGQCNPTYFTVGNLVQYLQHLEREGMSREEIKDKHVYLTAGACGPCRFGMYEAEYRLALRNAGFEGFRVLLFQQSGGLDQAKTGDGIVMNFDFFLGILSAFVLADLVNEVAYRIRPYEVRAGETDRVLAEIADDLYETMRARKSFVRGGAAKRARHLRAFAGHFASGELVDAMARARDRFDRIEVDRLRVKPLVKITGEFWAQTTEGDGNFNMFAFLERENAQVQVEPIATWITYMIHGAMNKIRDRKGLENDTIVPGWRRPWRRIRAEWRAGRRLLRLALARSLFRREYERLRKALGGTAHPLAEQLELERMGHPFYNSRAAGGEGHLEVAKNIYYHLKDLSHMVLSLKPFGCMPSTQSDAAQAAVVSRYPDMIFLPVETSGEGEINAHSRVQMALGEARAKAREEFDRALAQGSYPLEQIRAYVGSRPELRRPMLRIPHAQGCAGEAANFVLHVAERMRREGIVSRRAEPSADASFPIRGRLGKAAAA